ncbi:MAG: helix-turn-helix domain-containing protein [Streptosporangiaceae bacterium]
MPHCSQAGTRRRGRTGQQSGPGCAGGHENPRWVGVPPRRTITVDLADALREARLARGWSIRGAAKRIGCTHGTVLHLVAARRGPSAIIAEAILDAYGDALDGDAADELLAQAVDNAGRCWRPRS